MAETTEDLPDVDLSVAARQMSEALGGRVAIVLVRYTDDGQEVVDAATPQNAHVLETMAGTLLELTAQRAKHGDPNCPDCRSRPHRVAAAIEALGAVVEGAMTAAPGRTVN